MSIRHYAEGTSVTQSMPLGRFRSARVMCSDGKVRATTRLAATGNTFHSVPCAVKVRGRTVSGRLIFECRSGMSIERADDPWVVKFVANPAGRNAGQLPPGAWCA